MLAGEVECTDIAVHPDHAIIGTRGRMVLGGWMIALLDWGAAAISGKPRWLACDALAASAGWNPTVSI